MAAVRLGVLGGTFDPPHVGHLLLAEQAREQLDLERVLWVPAGTPWRKSEREVTAAQHRVAMVERAIAGNPAFATSRLEVDREGPSYSVETLEALHAQHDGAELFFIIGQDALEDLPNWKEPERLVSLATLAVAARNGAGGREAPAGLAARVVWVEMPRLDISATDLRRRVAAGLSLRYLVPDAVAEYIVQHGLYRS